MQTVQPHRIVRFGESFAHRQLDSHGFAGYMETNRNDASQGSSHAMSADSNEKDDGTLPLPVNKERGDTTAGGLTAAPAGLGAFLRRIRFLPLVFLLMPVVGVVALYYQPPGLRMLMNVLGLEPGGGTSSPIAVPVTRDTTPGEPAAPLAVVGLGKLLPRGDVTSVAPPFGSSDARIQSIVVAEGDRVEEGQLLATLDNEANLRAAIRNAEATLAARQAALVQTRNSVSASLAETRASLERARAALESARAEFERTRTLFERGYATNATLDQKRSARDQAANEVIRLEATLARFDSADIEEQADVAVARSNVETARADLERARQDLARALVTAPVSGTVLSIDVRPGERPGQAGIMEIGNIDQMQVEIEIYQTDIAKVLPGAPVTITAEALPSPLTGTVSKIGLEIGTQELIDPSPAASTNARVVKVTADLDEESSQAARRFTNLQVVARIGRPSDD